VTLLICAPTGKELNALLPNLTPEAGEEMCLLPVRLKKGGAFACATGVGPINAALAIGKCLAEAESGKKPIHAVLLAGLAGAFNLERLPLRALCLVRVEIWPEYGLHDGTSVTAKAFSFPLWQRHAKDGGDVYNRLQLDTPAALGLSTAGLAGMLTECVSLTVAGVSAAFARARDLVQRHHADLENMEGFAVAYACARGGIPCVELRSVSNKVGTHAKNEKDFHGALQSLARVLPGLNLI
jgi:futalosine hydrolase